MTDYTFAESVALARLDELDEGVFDSIRGVVDTAVARVSTLFKRGGEDALRARATEMVRDARGRFKPRAALAPPEAAAPGGVLSRFWSRVWDTVASVARRAWVGLQADYQQTVQDLRTPVTSEQAEVLFAAVVLGEVILLGLLPIFGPVVLVLFDRFVLPVLTWVLGAGGSTLAAVPGAAASVWDATTWGAQGIANAAWGAGQGVSDWAASVGSSPVGVVDSMDSQGSSIMETMSFADAVAKGLPAADVFGDVFEAEDLDEAAWELPRWLGGGPRMARARGPETVLGGIKRQIAGAAGFATGLLGPFRKRQRWMADNYIKNKLLDLFAKFGSVAKKLVDFAGSADERKAQTQWSTVMAFLRRDEEAPNPPGREASASEVANWFEKILYSEAAKNLATRMEYFNTKFLPQIAPDSDTSQRAEEIRKAAKVANASVDFLWGTIQKLEQFRYEYKGRKDAAAGVPPDAIAKLGIELGKKMNAAAVAFDDMEKWL